MAVSDILRLLMDTVHVLFTVACVAYTVIVLFSAPCRVRFTATSNNVLFTADDQVLLSAVEEALSVKTEELLFTAAVKTLVFVVDNALFSIVCHVRLADHVLFPDVDQVLLTDKVLFPAPDQLPCAVADKLPIPACHVLLADVLGGSACHVVAGQVPLTVVCHAGLTDKVLFPAPDQSPCAVVDKLPIPACHVLLADVLGGSACHVVAGQVPLTVVCHAGLTDKVLFPATDQSPRAVTAKLPKLACNVLLADVLGAFACHVVVG